MTKPIALISNDDGINSAFLHALVNAHTEHFEVYVCAPAAEQSWAGRSFSRHGDVSVIKRDDLPWPAWAIDGTPSDAVNIGLSTLLPKRPDIIVSGINVGFNVTLPLVLTSGTVAAAVEGALWGIRSVAYSQAVAPKFFEEVKRLDGHLDGPVGTARDQAAARAVCSPETLWTRHTAPTRFTISTSQPRWRARPSSTRASDRCVSAVCLKRPTAFIVFVSQSSLSGWIATTRRI